MDGVVTVGLVTGTVGGEVVEGVGSGYMTGTGGAVEGGLSVIGVGRGFKEGMVMVGFVEGTVIIVGVGFVEGTVVMGLVTWTGFRSSWTMFGLPAAAAVVSSAKGERRMWRKSSAAIDALAIPPAPARNALFFSFCSPPPPRVLEQARPREIGRAHV